MISSWNGLFVTKGPQDVIDKLAEIGKATMASDEAQRLMKETGARVYWQGVASRWHVSTRTPQGGRNRP